MMGRRFIAYQPAEVAVCGIEVSIQAACLVIGTQPADELPKGRQGRFREVILHFSA